MNECLEGSIPEITQDRKKCTICSWQKFCDKEAKENGYLTDIDGIGSKTASLLKAKGITNTQTLASYNEKQLGEKLSKFNEQKYEKASIFVKQAQAYISGEPYFISNKIIRKIYLKKYVRDFIYLILSQIQMKSMIFYMDF